MLTVVAAGDRSAVPASAQTVIVDNPVQKLPRDSGPHVLASSHLSVAVIERIAQQYVVNEH